MTQNAVTIINRPDFKASYANTVAVRSNLWDFCLTFGMIGAPAQELSQTTVEMYESVHLSPQVAKSITMILASQIADYERQFGKIPTGEGATLQTGIAAVN